MQDKEIKFVEISPDVYAVHPDSQKDMDDEINKALAKAGLPSLDDLRKVL